MRSLGNHVEWGYARCNWKRRQNWDSKKAGVGIGVTFGGGKGPVRRVSSSSPALTLP